MPPAGVKTPEVTGYSQGEEVLAGLWTQETAAKKPAGDALEKCQAACDHADFSGTDDEVKKQRELCYEACGKAYDKAVGPIEAAFNSAEDAVTKKIKKFEFDEVVIVSNDRNLKAVSRRIYPYAQKFLTVDNKADLIDALSTDWMVQTLRLFVHSGSDDFFVGESFHSVSMKEVTAALKARKFRMRAFDIDMNSCNGASGDGLTELLELTKPLDAGRDGTYFAWNKFHFFEWLTVTIPSGSLSQSERTKRLKNKLAFAEGYVVTGEPGPEELAKINKKSTRILVQWFSEDFTQKYRELPRNRTGQTEKDYQRIDEKKNVAVTGKGQAKAYEAAYNATPIHPNLDLVQLRGIGGE